MKTVKLQSTEHSNLGILLELFFPFIELLNKQSYLRQLSNGGENSLTLYPDYFTGEDLDACLNLFTEHLNKNSVNTRLTLHFKRYVQLSVHHLAEPIKIKNLINNFKTE